MILNIDINLLSGKVDNNRRGLQWMYLSVKFGRYIISLVWNLPIQTSGPVYYLNISRSSNTCPVYYVSLRLD